MKFNKLRLVGANTVDLPIVGAEPDGVFMLKSADGLGPPPVNVISMETVLEGSVRQGRRAQSRQIVARVGLQPDWDVGQTPEEIRAILYGLLTPRFGEPVKAQIVLDNTVLAQAQGDVSNFDVSLFSQDPEVQITLDCDHPLLFAPNPVVQLPTRTVVDTQTRLTIPNTGTAYSGFEMRIVVQQPLTSLQILDASPEGQRLTINRSWAAGDTLRVNTRPGERGVWRIPAGSSTEQSVLNDLSGDSSWLQLHGGTNELYLNLTTFDWAGNGFNYTPAYWGV